MALILFNMFIDTILFVSFATFICYTYLAWNFDYWKKRNVKFIKPSLFVGNFGDVFLVKKSISGYLSELYNKMSGLNYFGIWVFGTPHLIIRDPDLIKQILIKDFNYFNDRTIASDEKSDPIGAHLLFMMKNPMWKTVRAMLTPIYTTGKLKNMLPLIHEAGHELTTYLQKRQEYTIDVKELMAKFTTNVITSCSFGVNALSFEMENSPFRSVGRKMFNYSLEGSARALLYFFSPTIVKTLRLTFFVRGVNDFCRDAFWQAIDERRRTGIKRNDIVDIIIDMLDSNKFDGDQAVAQAVQFFAAGFETTSSTLSFALYELALYPQYQTKLRKEIKDALGDNVALDYDTINKLEFLDQVVKETLRKYPILPFLDRRCIQDYSVPNSDLVIEKGTPVYIPIIALQYDEKYFPNPNVFDPSRFSNENIANINPYAYLPFGTGPHNCIGSRFGLITAKIGITHMLANFFIERTDKTPMPLQFDPKSFLLNPLGELFLNVVPISQQISVAG